MKKEYKYTINGNQYEVTIGDIEGTVATVNVNGEEYKVEWEPEAEPEKKKPVLGKPAAAAAADSSAETASAANVNTNNAVKAPLPGVITSIEVAVGAADTAGDPLLVLAAMTMAINIDAETDGQVTAILVQAGQSVMEDDALVVIE